MTQACATLFTEEFNPKPGLLSGTFTGAANAFKVGTRIIERLAPRLRQDGLFFVGIDVIGGLLTEVNVTSPTGIQELDALTGGCAEGVLLDRVEARIQAGIRS